MDSLEELLPDKNQKKETRDQERKPVKINTFFLLLRQMNSPINTIKHRNLVSLFSILLLIVLIFSSCDRETDTKWLLVGEESPEDMESYLFRKTFHLEKESKNATLNISAHHKYNLYINGTFIGMGPQVSDPNHPKYDSYSVEDFLKPGLNIIAVEVINFGIFAGQNMFSGRTALWLNCPQIDEISSNKSWRIKRNAFMHGMKVDGTHKVRGGFLAPGCDSVINDPTLSDWYLTEYNDESWTRETGNFSSRQPVIRNIPFMERRIERFSKILKGKGEGRNFSFTDSEFSFKVEPNSSVSLLIDNKYLTTGFPEFIYSGGKGAEIKISYAESLYYPNQRDAEGNIIGEGQGKGNRNVTEGKEFIGYYDKIYPDGKRARLFRPSWYRTYRYILMEILTGNSPLIVEDFYGVFTAYPFKQEAFFESSDSILTDIWETAWRTARLCAWDTYMDCPYYEQLQYVGDTRIQALVSLYNTADPSLMKNAIEQFHWSIDFTGLTMAAYPSRGSSKIPPFSLFWTLMIKDYYMQVEDNDFVEQYLDEVKNIYDWHLTFMDENIGVIKGLDYWNFVDWPDEWAWDPELNTGGMPNEVAEGGISSILNMQFVYALQEFERIFRDFGKSEWADYYLKYSTRILGNIKELCWDNDSAMIADSPEKSDFSQHANLLAVLTGMIPDEESGAFIERISFDSTLIQTTIYYRFYLFEALRKAGRSDLYLSLLQPWKDMLDLGLTTFAERQEPTRSDCHAWSASPNYHLLSLVCGIEPTEPGFQSIVIRPAPGQLTWINACMPHPEGKIYFQFESGEEQVFKIELPENIKARFEFKDLIKQLNPGQNIIKFTD
jgi:hypothetical protein